MIDRLKVAELILEKIDSEKSSIKKSYEESKDTIGYFYVDDLLPEKIALEIYKAFPPAAEMNLNKSLREYKYIAAQMDDYDPILEEVLFAFQDKRIVRLISSICGIDSLYPDEHLYAGGISRMEQSQFLNPHLDNSHDKDRDKWRVLNLLYYVSPGWQQRFGGNLELWPDGMKAKQITILSKFNRLAVMATHESSWHSVSPVTEDTARCCISNYYFSDSPLKDNLEFHVTSFRGRPEQKFRNLVLQADAALRMGIRKVVSKGVVDTGHVYKK
ncbi:MAG: 2OG-Fe(II) oxygenase [Gammaproteobacteria bacterium]|nr:2OG-Fe(II) oxygenase [Gammaproteobacteria bacterium]